MTQADLVPGTAIIMICQRIRGFYDLLVVLQAALAAVAYWMHFFFVTRFYSEAAAMSNYVIYCVLFVLGLLLEATHRANFDVDLFQESLVPRHRVAMRQVLWAAAPVTFFLVAAKDPVISRVFLFSFLPVLYFLLVLSSWKLPPFVAQISFNRRRKEKTLLVGSSRKILALSGWLAHKAQLGLETVGVLCDERLKQVGGWSVLGRVEELERVVRERNITQVIAVELPAWPVFLGKLTSLCELLGVRFMVVSDLEEKFRHRVVHMENDGRHIFGLRQEPLESPINRAVKRCLDLVVALPVVLFIFPPLAALVWLLHRAQSPGPLFYCQDRAGFQGRSFRIFKFRTMHEHNSDATRQATENDERIFSAGRWLRRLSIDEIPQFLNVLRGDMSVVGPRPHLPEHNQWFARVMENYFVRSLAQPGITGLAQVRGFRGEATDEDKLKQRVESDIYYLEHWSFTLDLLIIARTTWQIFLPPKTAY